MTAKREPNVFPRFTVRLAEDPAELRRLARRLADWGADHEFPLSVVEHLALALDELITNTLEHGLPSRDSHDISVTVWCESDALVAEIIDSGAPFDPFAEQAAPDTSSPLAERKVGGLGLYLVRKLMDRYNYRRDSQANVTRITKLLA